MHIINGSCDRCSSCENVGVSRSILLRNYFRALCTTHMAWCNSICVCMYMYNTKSTPCIKVVCQVKLLTGTAHDQLCAKSWNCGRLMMSALSELQSKHSFSLHFVGANESMLHINRGSDMSHPAQTCPDRARQLQHNIAASTTRAASQRNTYRCQLFMYMHTEGFTRHCNR